MMMVGDLMESACQRDETEKAFTEYVHMLKLKKKTFNIMYMVQSGFVMAKERNIINLDSKCTVLLKTSMDKSHKHFLAR